MKNDEKTNVCRLLDKAKARYEFHTFDCPEAISGTEIASALGLDVCDVFKTLVTVGKSKNNYVFMVPVDEELDLKKAAKSVGEKSIEMIKSKELLPLTGYVHGGCSPIGMKKRFKTVAHTTIKDREKIFFSAGRIGAQIETTYEELLKLVNVEIADIIVEE